MSLPDKKNEVFSAEAAGEAEFAENFVNAAREMYAHENPNAARKDCFSNETIAKLANSAKLPDDSVMNHLFECSECFREYRQVLANRTLQAEKSAGWRNIFKLPSLGFALAGGGLTLLIGLSLFSMWLFRAAPSGEVTKNIEVSNDPPPINISPDNPANSAPLENKAARNSQAPPGNLESTPSGNNLLPKNRRKTETPKVPANKTDSLNLVLTADNILRDAANPGASRAIVLPARKINLNIRLPENFPDGRYKIRLTDAFENSLAEQNAAVKNRRLSANLDLRSLKNRANKICLQKDNETPDCFDLKIAK